jgi:hypothetical protein
MPHLNFFSFGKVALHDSVVENTVNGRFVSHSESVTSHEITTINKFNCFPQSRSDLILSGSLWVSILILKK